MKLAGLDLAQIQSGKFEETIQISRRGKPALRSALYQAALVAARRDSALRMKFLNMVNLKKLGKGQKRKVLVALACKILRIAFAVMKDRVPYDDSKHTLKQNISNSCAIMTV